MICTMSLFSYKSNVFPILPFANVKGNVECAKTLLNYNVDVNKPLNTSFDKMTPLMISAAKDDIQMVKFLVEQGKAKIEKPDKYKKTALIHAVMNGASKARFCKWHNMLSIDHEQYLDQLK